MNEWERQYRMACRYKEQYPPGTRGTVQCVDDIGTLHCDFDDGRHLGVIPRRGYFPHADTIGAGSGAARSREVCRFRRRLQDFVTGQACGLLSAWLF